MVEGGDFGKWKLNFAGRYLIATGFDLNIPKLYPAVYKYLSTFKEELIRRQDQGANWWNLRACDYYDKFSQPKIIYYHTAIDHSFYYDVRGYYISANCYMISNADKYLVAILNSSLFTLVKRYLFPAFGDVDNRGRIRLDYNKMITLPVKNISQEEQKPFINLVDKILSITKDDDYLRNPQKQAKVKEYERRIDRMVYELYGLTPEEIAIVEGKS